MFWRSVLESYVWGLDLPDSRANVSSRACHCTQYHVQIRNETHARLSTVEAPMLLVEEGLVQ